MKKLLIAGSIIIGASAVGGIALAQTDILSKANVLEAKVTADEATKIAKDIFDGTIVEFEYDNDLPFPHYDFELVGTDEKVDIEVNALTGKGKITEREPWLSATSSTPIETPNKQEGTTEQLTLVEDTSGVTANISLEQAAKIALQQAAGTVTGAERDGDVYEIEIRNGQYEYDIDVHVSTGEVLKIEKEIDK